MLNARSGFVTALTLGLGLWTCPGLAATFQVSSAGWDDTRDSELTLREANAMMRSGNACLTTNEKNRVSSGNFVQIFLTAPGCSVPVGESRWIHSPPPSQGFGELAADTLRFDDSVGTISPGNSIYIGDNDEIDGLKPNNTRVVLQGPGTGGAAFHAIDLRADSDYYDSISDDVTVQSLVIDNFNGDGIKGVGTSSGAFRQLQISNCDQGIHLGVRATIDGDVAPVGNQIDERNGNGNFIFSNRGDGVRMVGTSANTNNYFNGVHRSTISGNGLAGVRFNEIRGSTIGRGDCGASCGSNTIYGHTTNGGVVIQGENADNNYVQHSSIGNNSGSSTGNGEGIWILSGADSNTVGGGNSYDRNELSGNIGHGILIEGSSTTNNVVAYNSIGLNLGINIDRGNNSDGMAIVNGATGTQVNNNHISGNARWGIYLAGSTTSGNVIERNYIGLGLSNGSFPNDLGGIWINDAPSNTIGSNNASTPGFIANSGGCGIVISGEYADGNLVRNHRIGLDTSNNAAGNNGCGIAIQGGADQNVIGGGAVVDRNFISSNTGHGVWIRDDTTDSNSVRGNYIGTDANGTADRGNTQHGVRIELGDSTLVEDNLISGNGGDGVNATGPTMTGLVVRRNTIGLDSDLLFPESIANAYSGVALFDGVANATIGGASAGNTIAGNGSWGVWVQDSATSATIRDNLIGIAYGVSIIYPYGNAAGGVILHNSSSGNTVRNNYFVANGTGANGAALEISNSNNNTVAGNSIGIAANGIAWGNSRGVRLTGVATGNVIGGTVVADRNLIASNANEGVGLFGASVANNTVQLNNIGTDGTNDRGNNTVGVQIGQGAHDNVIKQNLISGNVLSGVTLADSGTAENALYGNLIGCNSSCSAGIPNGEHGVRSYNNAGPNYIGPYPNDATNGGNIIMFNALDGVYIESGQYSAVRENSIAGNGGLGIDLGINGVTPNDQDDPDAGANNLQNFPIFSTVVVNGGNTSATMTLNTRDDGGATNFYADVYHSTACDASGYGEGGAYLGTSSFGLGGIGAIRNGSATVMFPTPSYGATSVLSATTTQVFGLVNYANTSEHSACKAVSDIIFRNGFQIGSGAPEGVLLAPVAEPKRIALDPQLSLLSRWGAPYADEVEITLRVANRGSVVNAALTLNLGVTSFVTVLSIDGAGNDCRLAGRIVCHLGGLSKAANEDIRIRFGLAPGATLGFEAELERAGVVVAQHKRAGMNATAPSR